jgi:hypothetical protein
MYKIIDDVDIEDFHAEIRKFGQDPADFEISETVIHPPTDCAPFHETGTATVRNTKSGVERTYPIGHLATFPADFAQDLFNGVFQ